MRDQWLIKSWLQNKRVIIIFKRSSIALETLLQIPHVSDAQIETRLHFLDGMRGWAALMVLFAHLIGCFLSNVKPSYLSAPMLFLCDGHLAVFIFFVISGFALTVKFIEHPKEHSLLEAASARYFRLAIPVLAISALIYLMMKAHLFYNVQVAIPSNSENWIGEYYTFHASVSHLLYASLYKTFFNYEALYTPSTWSLSFELQGSMILYFFLGFFRNLRVEPKLYFFIAGLFNLTLLIINPMLASLMIGYLIAELYAYSKTRILSPWLSILSATLFALTVTGYLGSHYWHLGIQGDQLAALLAAQIVLSVTFSPFLRLAFSSPISRFLGAISYPLFLVNIAIICSYSSYLFVTLLESGLSLHTICNIVLFSTIGVAIFVAYLLTPIERLSIRVSRAIGKKITGR